ncbi:Conserved protein of uncharacterised function%2C possible antitoxin VapB13 [Mycobacterium tuberculosis]|uniref:Conserved protein of uncharacterized function, possible antitoxin VapB13 n=2 Tax=Bacillati TaxID=1783272 RepID=A0A655AIG8_MYCTX|nr:Conserved protein of uncharacterised function%2C possible antitoxin VapB13 [Mycobacterium tuberculosis]
MSKRLQVLLDPDEWEELREIARRHRTTVSEWVRRTLREAREREPRGDLDMKLRSVRAAARHEFPTATSSRCSRKSNADAVRSAKDHGDPR